MVRSPDDVTSHTVPSGSTRPKRCGSFDGTALTAAAVAGAAVPGAGRIEPGPGRIEPGPGRIEPGPGRAGPGFGFGALCSTSWGLPDSEIVMSVTSCPPRGDPRTCRATRRLLADSPSK